MGETCNGCDAPLSKDQMLMEGVMHSCADPLVEIPPTQEFPHGDSGFPRLVRASSCCYAVCV